MFYDDHQIIIMEASKDALRKIKKNKTQKKNLLKEVSDSLHNYNIGKNFYEPYDLLILEGKFKVDGLYYDQLLHKLDESHVDNIQKILSSLFGSVKDIYEFINIKPEVYGKGIDFSILNESNEKCYQKLSFVIYEELDRSFYSLSREQRQKKYLEDSRHLSKKLIQEGTNVEEAIQYAVKTVVMENLLRKISFPFAVWSRVQHLTESDDYGSVFDQSKLIGLVESFMNKISSTAKIISAII